MLAEVFRFGIVNIYIFFYRQLKLNVFLFITF